MPKCDKCRSEYSSGGHYGGHDYCISCYVSETQADAQKRRKEEIKLQQRVEEERKLAEKKREERKRQEDRLKVEAMKRMDGREAGYGQAAQSWLAKRISDEKRAKAEQDFLKVKRQNMLNVLEARALEKMRAPETLLRKRARRFKKRLPVHAHKKWEAADPFDRAPFKMELIRRKHREMESRMGQAVKKGRKAAPPEPVYLSMKKKENEGFGSGLEAKGAQGGEEAGSGGIGLKNEGMLELRVKKGFPQTVAAGKGAVAELEGKNNTEEKVVAELVASATDAEGAPLACNSSPRVRTFPPNGKNEFSLSFAASEGAKRGIAAVVARLEEKAEYIDRAAKASKEIRLTFRIVDAKAGGKRP